MSLALAELVVGLVRPQPVYRTLLANTPAMHVEGDVLPHVLKPGYRGRFVRREFDTSISINSSGFRGPELRPSARRRLVILGDSFTFGHGVNDAEAYPAVLDSRLPEVDVVNGGFAAGSSPDMYRAWLIAHGSELGAAAIVVGFFVGNDIDRHDEIVWTAVDSEGLPTRIANSELVVVDHYLRPRVTPIGYRYPILRESHLFHLAGSLFRKLESAVRSSDVRPSVFDHVHQPETRRAVVATQRLVLSIDDWAKEHRIRFGVIMIPTLQQVDGSTGAKPQELFAAFFGENGIPYLDLLPAMKGASEPLYHPVDQHWNARGHEVAAGVIAEWLCRTPLLGCEPRAPL